MKVYSVLRISALIFGAWLGCMADVHASDLSFGYVQSASVFTQTGAFGDTHTTAYSVLGWQARGRLSLSRDQTFELTHREYHLNLGTDSRDTSLKSPRAFRDTSATFLFGVLGVGITRREDAIISFSDPYTLKWNPFVRWNFDVKADAEAPITSSAGKRGLQVRIGVSGGVPLMVQGSTGVKMSKASGYQAGASLGIRKPFGARDPYAKTHVSLGFQVEGRLESLNFTGSAAGFQGQVHQQVQEITPQILLQIQF